MKQAFLLGGDDVITDVISQSEDSIRRDHGDLESLHKFLSHDDSRGLFSRILGVTKSTKEFLCQVKLLQVGKLFIRNTLWLCYSKVNYNHHSSFLIKFKSHMKHVFYTNK